MSTDTLISIPLVVRDVQTIAAAFREAAKRPRTSAEVTSSESSYGALADRWADVTNATEDCVIIHFDGEPMFYVRQNFSEWGIVCAQLSGYAKRRFTNADLDTLEGEEDMLQAEYALDLMTRISEAIGDH